MTTYGYARVSTPKQKLTAQLEELKNKGVAEKNIFKEKFTGTTTDRPQFQALFDVVEKGDKVIVCKLDRLARNTKEALEAMEQLNKKGVSVEICNLGLIDSTSPTGKMIFTILMSVAEMERDMIITRCAEGKAVAKARAEAEGRKFVDGRPKRKLTQRYLQALSILKCNSFRQTENITGISKATLIRIKRQAIDEEIWDDIKPFTERNLQDEKNI